MATSRPLHILSNVKLFGGLSFDLTSAEFPENPVDPTLWVKDGVLYVYTAVAGVSDWYPLFRMAAMYKHDQTSPSLEVTVTHNLNVEDIWFQCQTPFGQIVSPSDVDSTDPNVAVFTFTDNFQGKILVIGTGLEAQEVDPPPTQTYPEVGVAISAGDSWAPSKSIPDGDLVGTTGVQTLEGKTLKAPREVVVAMGSGTNIDLSAGSHFTKTISAATEFTISNLPPAGSVQTFTLKLTNPGGYALTFPANFKFVGGAIPTNLTVSGTDTFVGFVDDGATVSIFLSGRDNKVIA